LSALRLPERRLIVEPQLRRTQSAEVEAVTKPQVAGSLIKALDGIEFDHNKHNLFRRRSGPSL